MAVIRPFRAVRYNPASVAGMHLVVTQPYDRIPADLQSRYYQQHAHNFVRIIKNRPTEDDSPGDNIYTRPKAAYEGWLSESVLMREPVPAVYVYHQTYSLSDGSTRTRKALMASLELTPFDEGTVLPHERTLSGPKQDRLNLFRANGVNFEPIFMLYPDSENRINSILDEAIAGQSPVVDTRELFEQEVRQQLWVVTDAEVIASLEREMLPKRNLIIADGHHRYETALAYRDEMRQSNAVSEHPGFDFTLVSLVSMEDPGLVILPTHRLVHSLSEEQITGLLVAVGDYFDIRSEPDRAAMLTTLHATENGHAFGFVTAEDQYILLLKDESVMNNLAPEHGPAWRRLDVAILHQLVLEKLLGLSPESIQDQENLRYLRDLETGYAALDAGEAQCLFVLNPTRMEQVRACAAVGEKMPQKSTDFYPKMISGLVMMPLVKSASVIA